MDTPKPIAPRVSIAADVGNGLAKARVALFPGSLFMLIDLVESQVAADAGSGVDCRARVVHSGNLGDVLYSLPAVRALGASHYLLNLCHDPGLWQRSLSLEGARFLSPLLLAQPCIATVEIVRAPLVLYDMQGVVVSEGLPLEGAKPDAIGAGVHLLDRFRLDPQVCQQHLIHSHAAAVGVTVDAAAPFIEIPGVEGLREQAACADAPVVVSLTPRYRSAPTRFFTELLRDCPNVVKVGIPSEAHVYADLPGVFYTAVDALDLAQLIARARLFVGAPSMPYAIAEGLKVPRLIDVFSDLPNAFPLGELGWRLSGDPGLARAQLDAIRRRDWDAAALQDGVRAPAVAAPATQEGMTRANSPEASEPDASGSLAADAELAADALRRNASLVQAISRLESENESLRRDLDALLRSRSWRWGAPLRRLSDRLRGRLPIESSPRDRE